MMATQWNSATERSPELRGFANVAAVPRSWSIPQAITEAREGLARIASFREGLDADLPAIRRAEAIKELRTAFDALDVNAKGENFAEWWRDQYSVHAEAIAAGLRMEQDALRAFDQARALASRFADLGEEMPEIETPARLAAGGLISARSLGELVTLPGRLGAPRIPAETNEVTTKRLVDQPIRPAYDRDTPSHLLPTRKVEVVEKSLVSRPLRQDTPIWWPPRSM